MAVHETMTFVYGVTTCTLPAPAAGSWRAETVRVQAQATAADGTLFVDDKGVTRWLVRFRLVCTRAQAVALESFYRATVQGALYAFTFTDHLGRAWAGCTFHDDQRAEFTKTAGGRYEIEISLRATQAIL